MNAESQWERKGGVCQGPLLLLVVVVEGSQKVPFDVEVGAGDR